MAGIDIFCDVIDDNYNHFNVKYEDLNEAIPEIQALEEENFKTLYDIDFVPTIAFVKVRVSIGVISKSIDFKYDYHSCSWSFDE